MPIQAHISKLLIVVLFDLFSKIVYQQKKEEHHYEQKSYV